MPETALTVKPGIVIFGDTEEKLVAKTVWALLAGQGIRLIEATDRDDLARLAPEAALILCYIDNENGPDEKDVPALLQREEVVADVIALTYQADVKERMDILANGYDAIFHMEFLEYPALKKVLQNRVIKGQTRLRNHIQQEEYARFRAALAASPDAFIVFDGDNKLFFVSEHYKRSYAGAADILVRGLDVMDAFEALHLYSGVTRDDPRYQVMKNFWQRLEGQTEFTTNEGRTWRIKASRLPDGYGTIVTTTDITNYVRQQRELETKSLELAEALDKEKEANDLQKQFITMVSHEFRTPLSIIDGNAQILQRRSAEMDIETLKRRTGTIRNAVSRLINMMEGVLSSNMLKTGRLNLTPEIFDLKLLIGELCDEYADLNKTHNITIDTAKLPDTVRLDKKVVTLVVGNLLSNSIKYSRENPVINVTAEATENGIRICVHDKGIGIPVKEQEKVFDRFYRASTAGDIPGTGIGLSLVRDLIALHKGNIELESAPDEGTTITVTLPELEVD